MNLDFLGAEQNLTTLIGQALQFLLELVDDKGEAVDLSDVVFDGLVTGPDGMTADIEVEHTDAEGMNVLRVVFPELMEVNSYGWEIRAVSEGEEKIRVAYGKLGVLPTNLDLLRSEDGDPSVYRHLLVRLPGEETQRVTLMWKGGTIAQMYAVQAASEADRAQLNAEAAAGSAQEAQDAANEAKAAKEGIEEKIDAAVKDATKEAQDYAEEAKTAAGEAKQAVKDVQAKAQEAAEEATKEAKEMYEQLNKATDKLREDVEETRQSADATVQKLEVFLAEFDDNVRSVVWVDPGTEHLMIGGKDTGCKVTGDPGKSPYINEVGHWIYWNDETKEWLDGGAARGEDGFSPYINELGNFVYKDPLTGEIRDSGVCARGKDGRDGTSVQRHLIGSVDELPTDEELCNGGHMYYVKSVSLEARARIDVQAEGRSDEDTCSVAGVSVQLPGAETEPEEAAAQLAQAINESGSGVYAEAEGSVVHLVTGGSVLTVNLQSAGEGYKVTEYPFIRRSGYDIYAWVTAGGGAEWTRVGETYDVARSDSLGTVQLGTDEPIEGGAKVGLNRQKQMEVPAMSFTVRGTAMLGLAGPLSGGGAVGADEEGRLMVQQAEYGVLGAVSPSYNGFKELQSVVGINVDGSLGIPWAELDQPGVVALGSSLDEDSEIPYLQGVGATAGHLLANNLLVGGAIQHRKYSDWKFRDAVEAFIPADNKMKDWCFYLGLNTSDQFTQSEHEGLRLLAATASRIGGVMLSMNINDVRKEAVLSASVMRDYVQSLCYTKGETDEKVKEAKDAASKELSAYKTEQEKELNNYKETVNSTLDNYKKGADTSLNSFKTETNKKFTDLNNLLKNYWKTVDGQAWCNQQFYTKSHINNNYYQKAEVDSKIKSLQTAVNNKVTACSAANAIEVLNASEDISAYSKAHPKTLVISSEKQAKK